jgi:hypothetical protein
MVDKIAGVATTGATGPNTGASFSKALENRPRGSGFTGNAPQPSRVETGRSISKPDPAKIHNAVEPGSRLPSVSQASSAQRTSGGQMLTQIEHAQARLDKLLKMAESGRTFSPAELLAFQAHAYRASQELDLAGKIVEKATSGVKQTLQTQI